MAGGIDWFRWHHGTVTDQKFPLIAKRSGATVAEVIAVWACVLEAASMSEVRGCAGEHDFEAMDCALGLVDGRSKAIYQAMQARELVDKGGHVEAWNRRQPKREREDDTAAERKRRQRERQADGVTPPEANDSRVTPSHATSHQNTPRGEESREEKNHSEANASGAVGAKPPLVTDPDEIIFGYGVPLLTAAGIEEKQARTFLGKLRKEHGDAAVVNALRECIKAKPLQPLSWLAAALPPKGKGMNKQEAIEADGKRVARQWLAEQGATT